MFHSEPSSITSIEPQKKYPDRVSVFVDGEFVIGVHIEVIAIAGLWVGQPISVPELQTLAAREEARKARESALNLLGVRARSRKELRDRLLQKGFAPEAADEALQGLERSGFVNDAEFSEAWVRGRTGGRPMGPNRLSAELRQKGVDRELIDQALQAIDPEMELDLALTVGRQKVEQFRGKTPQEQREGRRKLAALLQRRGFSWNTCTRVLDILLNDDE